MTVIAGSIVLFAIAILFLSVGVILKKRTPLKGACHAPLRQSNGGEGTDPGACESCACGRESAPEQPGQGSR